jgi:triacylglycerol esterase/lipase EstA (alpha/beta hydrolase family)
VFLLPGFFGFDHLGDLAYFAHVRDALTEWCRREAVDVRLYTVPTRPTASLRHRAADVLATMSAALSADPSAAGGPVHLVGHSSGGLDARLVVTPEVHLPDAVPAEPLAARVRTVVTLATPHYGTPVAGFLSSVLGAQLLGALSLATSYVLRTGRLPLDVLAKLGAAFVRVATRGQSGDGQGGGAIGETLRRLTGRILADIGPDRRGALQSFAELIARDQDLLPQITPAAIDVFNAATQDRPGVRYGCVVTQARGASVRSFLSAGLSPYAHASHALYVCISQLAARVPADRVPALTPDQAAALRAAFGADPSRRANDGIVPTLSQVWGPVLHATWGDHLDVIGHFDHPTHVPPHFDWLTSGSGHTRQDFLATWEAVARFLFTG